MESVTENIFDPEVFRSDLQIKTEEYAYHRQELGDEHRKRAKELYSEILNDCAEALTSGYDQEVITEIIQQTFLFFRYDSEINMFEHSSISGFWKNLALLLAQNASEK